MAASIEALKAELMKIQSQGKAQENEPIFVKPHFLEELGCEGLTSQEVADSLGMRHDNLLTLVTRLIKSNDILDTEAQELNITRKNAIGGTYTIKTVYLTTDAAKFVVTQSSTKLGMAYCRFLISCEKALTNLANTKVNERLDKLEKAIESLSIGKDSEFLPRYLKHWERDHSEFLSLLFNKLPSHEFFIARAKAEKQTGTDQYVQGEILRDFVNAGILKVVRECIPGKLCTYYGFTAAGADIARTYRSKQA
jgi:hypothetical protein